MFWIQIIPIILFLGLDCTVINVAVETLPRRNYVAFNREKIGIQSRVKEDSDLDIAVIEYYTYTSQFLINVEHSSFRGTVTMN